MKEFTHHMNPYGTLVLENITVTPITTGTFGTEDHVKHCQETHKYVVSGTVKSGGITSRLFQFTTTRDMTGEEHSVWAVSQEELSKGEKTTFAM